MCQNCCDYNCFKFVKIVNYWEDYCENRVKITVWKLRYRLFGRWKNFRRCDFGNYLSLIPFECRDKAMIRPVEMLSPLKVSIQNGPVLIGEIQFGFSISLSGHIFWAKEAGRFLAKPIRDSSPILINMCKPLSELCSANLSLLINKTDPDYPNILWSVLYYWVDSWPWPSSECTDFVVENQFRR